MYMKFLSARGTCGHICPYTVLSVGGLSFDYRQNSPLHTIYPALILIAIKQVPANFSG